MFLNLAKLFLLNTKLLHKELKVAVDLFCKITLKTTINIIPDIISSIVDIAVLSESLHN
jgi:hypothetical protein